VDCIHLPLGIGTSSGLREDGNETSDSIRRGEVLTS
jgi:hypothetical protein